MMTAREICDTACSGAWTHSGMTSIELAERANICARAYAAYDYAMELEKMELEKMELEKIAHDDDQPIISSEHKPIDCGMP
jgi:hypothetical protein